jgi:hypothetical protein
MPKWHCFFCTGYASEKLVETWLTTAQKILDHLECCSDPPDCWESSLTDAEIFEIQPAVGMRSNLEMGSSFPPIAAGKRLEAFDSQSSDDNLSACKKSSALAPAFFKLC